MLSGENRKAITIGVLTTLLCVYFIEPILSFLGKIGLSIVKAISSTLYDRLFEEVALGKPNYDFVLVTAMFAFLIVPIFVLFRSGFSNMEVEEEVDKIDEENLPVVLAEIENMTNKIVKIERRIVWVKIVVVVVYLLGLGQMVLGDIKLKTIQAFEQQIRILTPYMDPKVKDKIISDFSRMKTYGNFLEIDKKINRIADSVKIKLPKTRNHIF